MRHIVLIALLFLCTHAFAQKHKSSASSTSKKSVNMEETSLYGDEKILIGATTREAFSKSPYSEWFNREYQSYKPKQEITEQLKPLLKAVHIKVFMGSWCGDSKREVPRFYKILDQTGFKTKNLQVTNLRQDKTGLNQEEKTYSITNVPTFILYKKGKEIGRITEFPQKTLEEDLLAILTQNAPQKNDSKAN